MFASVLFPAVTIKMSNFSTCFITSTPIKRYYDSYKLISLTGMKTRCDFLENIFAIFTFFQDSSIFVVVVLHTALQSFSIERTRLLSRHFNKQTKGESLLLEKMSKNEKSSKSLCVN